MTNKDSGWPQNRMSNNPKSIDEMLNRYNMNLDPGPDPLGYEEEEGGYDTEHQRPNMKEGARPQIYNAMDEVLTRMWLKPLRTIREGYEHSYLVGKTLENYYADHYTMEGEALPLCLHVGSDVDVVLIPHDDWDGNISFFYIGQGEKTIGENLIFKADIFISDDKWIRLMREGHRTRLYPLDQFPKMVEDIFNDSI